MTENQKSPTQTDDAEGHGDQPLVRRFLFHWNDGKTDEASGEDAAKAFSALGYGGGAIAALDYYEEVFQTSP